MMGEAMSFEPGALFVSFLLGFVGLGLFIYGKKASRMPHLIAGLLFMVYPYFTETTTSTVVVGVILGAGLWLATRMGW